MCCGYPGSAHAIGSTSRSDRVLFEYQGSGPLIAYGRVTGTPYHFPGPTARVAVDARDAPYLDVVQGLTRATAVS